MKPYEYARSQIQGFHASGNSISCIATIVYCDRYTARISISALAGQISDAKRSGRRTKMAHNIQEKVCREL